MACDEKQFLELLREYKSDETKKARRNVSTIAFVIIAAEIWVLLLAAMLLLYCTAYEVRVRHISRPHHVAAVSELGMLNHVGPNQLEVWCPASRAYIATFIAMDAATSDISEPEPCQSGGRLDSCDCSDYNQRPD